MIQFDPEKVKELVCSLYLTRIKEAYGDIGVTTLCSLIENLRRLYQYIDAESINGSIVVYKSIDNRSGIHPEWKSLTDIAYLTQECPAETSNCLNVEFCDDGTIRYDKGVVLDLKELSESAIVYFFKNRQDVFIIKGEAIPFINPCPSYASFFCMPTHIILKDALEDYKRRNIRTSNCPVFPECWYGGKDGPRLFFKQKPESTMRRSLYNFLDNVLRGAEVGQEQVVDESHPVDIRVVWMGNNRRALIEIKWLGQSVDEDGKKKTGYTDYRANQGAKQLVDYIDAEYRHLALHERRGYLVIIDGRRKGLSEGCTTLDPEDSMWYQDKEIQFEPKYHEQRRDFNEPIRMFAEPKMRYVEAS